MSIIHDVLDAVAYMHARGITHRDLKFENIMFSSPETDAVKVIDFGLSKKYSKEEQLRDTVGKSCSERDSSILDERCNDLCNRVLIDEIEFFIS